MAYPVIAKPIGTASGSFTIHVKPTEEIEDATEQGEENG